MRQKCQPLRYPRLLLPNRIKWFPFWVLIFIFMTAGPLTSPFSSANDSTSSKRALLPSTVGSVLKVNEDAITSAEVITAGHEKLTELTTKLNNSPAQSKRELFVAQTQPLITELVLTKVRDLLLYQFAKAKLEQIPGYEDIIEAERARHRQVIIAQYDGSEARAQAKLAAQDMTIDDILETFTRQIIIASFRQTNPVGTDSITRTRMMQYYNNHLKEKYSRDPLIQFQLIDIQIKAFLVSDPQSNPTDEQLAHAKAQAEKNARQALQKIQNGADFTVVVMQYSHGFRKKHDGVWESRSPDSFRKQYQPVIIALKKIKIGQCTDIIETSERFFIAKLLDRKDGQKIPFSQVQSEITEILANQRWQKYWRELSFDLWNKATIGDLQQFVRNTTVAACQQFGFFEPTAKEKQ